ncbi:hypothetical protein ACOMHN_014825 [Nucella lapillus]
MTELATKFHAIGPQVTKIEGLVVNTNTGRSAIMREYFLYWEKKVFDALTKLILVNLNKMNKAVTAEKPLFQIDALLAVPDIILNPPTNEIFKLTLQCVRDTVECLKLFERWMNGTCLVTPPKKVEGEDEPFVFSFQGDVLQQAEVPETLQQVNTTIKTTLTLISRYFDRYKKYKGVWRTQKDKSSSQARVSWYEYCVHFAGLPPKGDAATPGVKTFAKENIRSQLDPANSFPSHCWKPMKQTIFDLPT